MNVEASALRSPSGESAWPRHQLDTAVDAIVAGGCAILGGEVWLVRGESITAGLRLRAGAQGGIGWQTDDRRRKEPWAEFVSRTAEETGMALEQIAIRRDIDEPAGGELYYNVSFVSEAEYGQLRASAPHPVLRRVVSAPFSCVAPFCWFQKCSA
jgi:hypothetical protein